MAFEARPQQPQTQLQPGFCPKQLDPHLTEQQQLVEMLVQARQLCRQLQPKTLTWLSSSSLSSCWYRREDGWWMVVMMERPPCASARSDVSRCIAVVESSPLVGSSSSRMEGLMMSSWPTEARLRSPPEMPFRKKPPAQNGCRMSGGVQSMEYL